MNRRAALAVLTALFVTVPAAVAEARPTSHASRSAAGCATHTSRDGTLTACPGRGPIGTAVTLTGTGCHSAGSRSVLAVFLGPKSYIGSSGGGVDIVIPVHNGRFAKTFDIPTTYPRGGDHNAAVRVTPGSGYHFGVYPAGLCAVPFVVTAPGSPVARTGPELSPVGLSALAIVLLLLGGWTTRKGRVRKAQ